MGPSFQLFEPTAVTKFQGKCRQRGVIHGDGNFFTIFERNRRLSRKRYETDPVTMDH